MYNLQETDIKVYKTDKFHLFKRIKGNRAVNPSQVNKLKKSMQKHGYLMDSVVVNDNFEVIDGQHRLRAAEDVGLSVLVIIADGYDKDEMLAQNLSQKSWGKKDFLNYFCERGYDHYLAVREFMNHYDFVSVNDSIKLLQNSTTNPNQHNNEPSRKGIKEPKYSFEKGTWEVQNIDLAYDMADKIKAIGQYFEGYKTSRFISVMITLINSDKFNYDKFMKKLKRQQTKMVRCATAEQYRMLIEEIYNHGSRNKVGLRYL